MVDFMNFENYSCDNQMSIFDFTREPISITKPIRLIELFAGYGSQAMALKRIGAKFEHYRVVEFDKYAIASYNAVHGTDFPTMDITKVHAEDLNICGTETFTYLLTYSFPCTDLSVAGKQAGMSKGSGTRSGLMWEVERILTEIRDSNGELPQILFMENVPQVHSQDNMPDFRKWLDFLESLGYTNYYQDLNAKNYGVAQNRERCFMFSFLGEYNYHFPQPIPLKKKLKDYLEDNVDEKYYINNEKADKLIKQLIDNGTLPQHSRAEFQTCGQTETLLLKGMASKKYEPYAEKVDICTTLCARDYKGLNNFGQNGVIEVMADVNVIGSLEAKFESTSRIYDAEGYSPTFNAIQGTSNCLTSVQKDNLALEKPQYRIRKLTPRTCGRLMGVSDEDIDKMAAVNGNTQLYKQFGNSIVVDVMCAMFKNLNINQ